MKLRAIVAVHPDVEAEINDGATLDAMPLNLQTAVRGRSRAALRGLVQGAVTWPVYQVRGTKEALIAAETRWAENIITMGSWNPDGTRVGTKDLVVVDKTDPQNPVISRQRVGAPVRELHARLLDCLDDIVEYHSTSADGLDVEIGRRRPLDLTHLPVVLGERPMEM